MQKTESNFMIFIIIDGLIINSINQSISLENINENPLILFIFAIAKFLTNKQQILPIWQRLK